MSPSDDIVVTRRDRATAVLKPPLNFAICRFLTTILKSDFFPLAPNRRFVSRPALQRHFAQTVNRTKMFHVKQFGTIRTKAGSVRHARRRVAYSWNWTNTGT
jgi:hypothetical protein